jgi:hypothetical protein
MQRWLAGEGVGRGDGQVGERVLAPHVERHVRSRPTVLVAASNAWRSPRSRSPRLSM